MATVLEKKKQYLELLQLKKQRLEVAPQPVDTLPALPEGTTVEDFAPALEQPPDPLQQVPGVPKITEGVEDITSGGLPSAGLPTPLISPEQFGGAKDVLTGVAEFLTEAAEPLNFFKEQSKKITGKGVAENVSAFFDKVGIKPVAVGDEETSTTGRKFKHTLTTALGKNLETGIVRLAPELAASLVDNPAEFALGLATFPVEEVNLLFSAANGLIETGLVSEKEIEEAYDEIIKNPVGVVMLAAMGTGIGAKVRKAVKKAPEIAEKLPEKAEPATVDKVDVPQKEGVTLEKTEKTVKLEPDLKEGEQGFKPPEKPREIIQDSEILKEEANRKAEIDRLKFSIAETRTLQKEVFNREPKTVEEIGANHRESIRLLDKISRENRELEVLEAGVPKPDVSRETPPEPAVPEKVAKPEETEKTEVVETESFEGVTAYKIKKKEFIDVPEPARIISLSEFHRNSVEKALREGKTVPPEVLKDYPDLAPKKPITDKAPEGDLVGLNKERIAEVRQRLDLENVPEKIKQSFEADAERAINEGVVEKTEDIAAEVTANPRPITAVEHQAMLIKEGDLLKEYDNLDIDLQKTDKGSAQYNEIRAKKEQTLERIDRLTEASDLGGTEASRALGARRALKDSEGKFFTKAGLVGRAKEAKGGKLDIKETIEFEKMAEEYKKLTKEVDELRAKEDARITEEQATLAERTAKELIRKEKAFTKS